MCKIEPCWFMMPFRLPWFRRRISNIGDLSPTVGDQHLAHVINEFRLRLSSSISILHRLCSIPWEFHIPFKAKLRSLSLLTDFQNWIFTKKISSFNYWNSKSLLRLVCEPTQINSNKIIFCILIDLFVFKIIYICIEWVSFILTSRQRLPQIHTSILTQMSGYFYEWYVISNQKWCLSIVQTLIRYKYGALSEYLNFHINFILRWTALKMNCQK